jgi:hypothetical protein
MEYERVVNMLEYLKGAIENKGSDTNWKSMMRKSIMNKKWKKKK